MSDCPGGELLTLSGEWVGVSRLVGQRVSGP